MRTGAVSVDNTWSQTELSSGCRPCSPSTLTPRNRTLRRGVGAEGKSEVDARNNLVEREAPSRRANRRQP